MKKILLLLITLIFVRCSRSDDEIYFNGKIFDINTDSVKIHQMTTEEPVFSGYTFTYEPIVCNNLIVGQHSSQNFVFNVIDISKEEVLGNFVLKGNARNEVISPSILKEVFVENDQMKALIIDINKRSLYKWNITKSLAMESTQFDYIVGVESNDVSLNYLFFTPYNKSKTLIYSPASNLIEGQKRPERPVIKVVDDNLSKVHQTFHLFKKTFKNIGDNLMDSDIFYYSDTNIHPDKDYIVQSMWFLPQINILDLRSGEVKGFRLSKGLDFSIFKTPSQLTDFYFCGGVCTTRERIYLGYKDTDNSRCRSVYEFNWQGELLNIYELDIDYDKIIYDSVAQKLYAYQMDSGSLFLLEI